MIHPTKRISLLVSGILFFLSAGAQSEKPSFTHADTLRGSMNAERTYDVLRYDITFTPDFENKSIRGQNTITYLDPGLTYLQLDLQVPLDIDSVIQDGKNLVFQREGNAFHI